MSTNRQISQALSGLRLGTNSENPPHDQPVPAALTLEQVLAGIGPLPREALFLGIAPDGLPVLLNLHDPNPGPMLVIGDEGAGKTAFLQSVASSLLLTHSESEVQFLVITQHTVEWEGVGRTGHQVGIFEVNQTGTKEFILSLTSWAHTNKNTQQSILVLIDDLECIAKMEIETVQNLRWLLLRGPSRRVWPIITMNADRYGQVLAWIQIFRTRVFGRVANPRVARALGSEPAAALDRLEAGVEFSMRENGRWLKFCLPSF